MKSRLLKIGLSLVLLIVLFHLLDISVLDIWKSLSHGGFVILAAILPLTVIPWIASNRWSYILRLSGIDEHFLTLWGLLWKATFLGLFLPGSQGGDFFRILFIERRHPDSRGVAGSTVFIERMIGFLLLGLFALAALPLVYDGERFRVVLVMVLGVNGVMSLVVLAVFLVRWRNKPRLADSGVSRYVSRVVQYLHRFHEAVQHFPYRRGLLPTVLWIAAFQLSLITVVHLLFMAFGYPVTFLHNLLLYPLIGLLTVVPITWSGFGVREGAFVFFYSLVGVPPEVAVGVSLLTYLLVVGMPALLGGILILIDSGGFISTRQ